MKYEEDLKKKYPYRFTFQGTDFDDDFNKKFQKFTSKFSEFVSRKNYRLGYYHSKFYISIKLYFRNKDDAFMFKLNFSDDEIFTRYLNRNLSPNINVWIIDG